MLTHRIIHPPPVICDGVRHLGRIVASILGTVVICDGPALVGPGPGWMYGFGGEVIREVDGSAVIGGGLGILAAIEALKAFNSDE